MKKIDDTKCIISSRGAVVFKGNASELMLFACEKILKILEKKAFGKLRIDSCENIQIMLLSTKVNEAFAKYSHDSYALYQTLEEIFEHKLFINDES